MPKVQCYLGTLVMVLIFSFLLKAVCNHNINVVVMICGQHNKTVYGYDHVVIGKQTCVNIHISAHLTNDDNTAIIKE